MISSDAVGISIIAVMNVLLISVKLKFPLNKYQKRPQESAYLHLSYPIKLNSFLCRYTCGPSCSKAGQLDNFIRWISHYPTVSICVKISVFPRVQANMHTLTTAKFRSVRKPWTTFNVKYIIDPE